MRIFLLKNRTLYLYGSSSHGLSSEKKAVGTAKAAERSQISGM
jgi:hypothetical protein